MANKKFSEFTLKTDSANVDFVVGYDGTDNVRIAPDNLGGGGASDLNGLSDVTIENTDFNAYFIDIPASRSGDLGNLGLGVDALDNLTSGKYNLAIGANTLNNLTTSQNATAVGYYAGAEAGTTLMGDTTLIGNRAGFGRSGYRTVAVGAGAMGFGSGKTAVNRNTAIGYHALYRIDTNGADNVALGHEASQFLTTATKNIAIGDNAGRSSTATGHISIGYQAGYSNTSGTENTNIGYEAGYSNSTGSYNTNLGYQALKTNTASNNTAVGYQAGTALTTGSDNVIIGKAAGQSQTTASGNVLIGLNAGINGNGGQSTIIGYQAGDALQTGAGCTAVGYGALSAEDFRGYHTAVGSFALSSVNSSTGYCTGLGRQAGSNFQNANNSMCLGANAQPSTNNVDDEITLGNSSIATLRCQVTSITALSDERDKTDIEDLPYGLDFINSLNPKKFVWNNRVEIIKDINEDGEEIEKEVYSSNKGKKDVGFIAQELQTVDDDYLSLVYDANPDKLEATYGRLIPVLVQAIKELKAEVELLKA